MSVTLVKEKYSSKVGEVVLGATAEQGGTRTSTITVGGDSALPFLHFEGETKNRPVIAMEVTDVVPSWPDTIKNRIGDVINDPAAWAKKCVDDFGADLIYLKLDGADPEGENRSPEDCARIVKDVLAAVGVPLIVEGCDDGEKNNEIMAVIAEAAAGENLLIGIAEQDNYKSITAAAMVHKHTLIARSPLDINICKQLNILINEMGLPLNKIVIDPTVAGLGFGIEYVYSIMERARLGALANDKMLSMPIICTVGHEANRCKEAYASVEEFPGWGDLADRSVLWEAVTASGVLQVGASILVMRNPAAVSIVKKNIADMMGD
ncbi:acetyl-CoA decarbonylase/synthase complex subunit delta [Desulfosporosinus sp.]|uniref:acetyl-CoA decarbonylase/synthase complex subunit delta n=1 Tax=Desulfosporosinus sp. TaxID=157907 RepID=UPI000E8321FD|nr:acetyl-CoA decarbonylase/synthase complex subunit delta [Desulfosporosinus sp.]MBC2724095.1 acetyl-CoA decarbonylase/synthase complex subunit delta [Desulfosporosinus sp.]MBC2725392.1 acetyl-CoA decarbonylase/synthase complex subunit delta [Desulfosporosinus sp.]HBV85724.1 acetyl-CoA decarbonylase/synthase complex subunit delta [Desulfosporosinus sp.]